MDKILLIDGFNAFHRASIGFSPAKKVEGDPNSFEDKPDYTTVFNFFRNLRPIIEQFTPDKCFVVLEGHPKFRYDIFPEYKANRRMVKTGSKQAEADRFLEQKDIIIQLLKYLPITLVKADDYECDDVIATLAHNLADEDITILSADSDFIQLLQVGIKNIKIYNPIAKKFYTDPGYHYVAWKCLVGDSSDNIPGFDGIGDKKAQKMLADPTKFSDFMMLEENRANFMIYKSLIELRSVPVEEIKSEDGITNWDELKLAFEAMEFHSITNEKSWEKYKNTFSCIKY